MKFPPEAVTNLDKLEFAHISQEKLRLEHNLNGDNFRNRIITEAEFRDYQKNSFGPRQLKISEAISTLTTAVFPMIQDEKKEDRRNRLHTEKLKMRKSVKFDPDINNLG